MPDEPLAESATVASPAGTPPTPEHSRSFAQLANYAALALAVVAVALAALAYFHPAHHGAAAPVQQSGDAKANVCGAFGAVRKAVVLNTHLQTPENNPIGELAVAGNARLALVGGGAYLQRTLAANTAAPADLTKTVSAFADTIGQLGIGYLAGGTPDTLQPLRHNLDSQISDAAKACS
ncbi:hypothetical protein PT015_03170 [Candidatus Mycobacterium wuenschmannii]|uniref:Alanine and proline rich membrane protein n=1 Tax=Candidatus Mycobacterium wuenschmannii TaxID=3027808 RepID=A0ABY8W0J2_9MYCO|nr:hypothetical protein [Candidatus Mycobacterium wuenschmannii]WIM88514.1 hypothetical protein PT015_03170 [Candidatus Mycobacterium wuenschmannii]